MKFLLNSLTIAIVIQVTVGANDPKAFYKATKGLVNKLKPMITAVLKDIPNAPAYGKYKTGLETFMSQLERVELKRGPCFIKTFAVMNDFVDLITPYEKENAPAEAKKVYELFNDHGFKDLDKEILKVALAYELDKIGNDLKKLLESKDAILSEEC